MISVISDEKRGAGEGEDDAEKTGRSHGSDSEVRETDWCSEN